MAPEAILKQDDARKNDCERSAAQRLLTTIRREHPHLKLIVVEDGLASNGPHIQLLKSLNMHFILGAKPKDHTFLFDWVDHSDTTQTYEIIDQQGTRHRFRYLNHVPLDDANFTTVKNQGYHFEHNFGYGQQYLATVFARLMMLAFLVDQIQQRCCKQFQKALQKARRKLYFWEQLRGLFFHYLIDSWEGLYGAIAVGVEPRN